MSRTGFKTEAEIQEKKLKGKCVQYVRVNVSKKRQGFYCLYYIRNERLATQTVDWTILKAIKKEYRINGFKSMESVQLLHLCMNICKL